jgi:methylated-DNA-[protein]-cysteine S-methyltransferase
LTMVTESRAYYDSPIGTIELLGTERGLTAVNFGRRRPGGVEAADPALRAAVEQLDEYFLGKRKEFSLVLHFEGTDFQKKAWRQLVRIPYGKTATYAEVAAAIGKPRAVRAVGQANHRNPISIIIPCHRVIGSDGRMVGYGSGLWRKEWLLAHEKRNAARARWGRLERREGT